MLTKIDKKDLAERDKEMKAAAQAPQDLKLKAHVTTVPTLTEDDKDITSRTIFKRRRKTPVAPTEHSQLDRHALSNHAPPSSPTPPRA